LFSGFQTLLTPVVEKRYTAGQVGRPGEGPFMTIILTLVGERIIDAKFQTYPCPAASACGHFVTTWAEGKTLSEIPTLTEDILLASTGAMPLGREHCPGLAVNALRDSLARYEKLMQKQETR
jgi:NifU-like protein involved in Fe-S cluster formation